MLAVQQIRVVRQTLVVPDVLAQGVAVITCQTTCDSEHGCDWPVGDHVTRENKQAQFTRQIFAATVTLHIILAHQGIVKETRYLFNLITT